MMKWCQMLWNVFFCIIDSYKYRCRIGTKDSSFSDIPPFDRIRDLFIDIWPFDRTQNLSIARLLIGLEVRCFDRIGFGIVDSEFAIKMSCQKLSNDIFICTRQYSLARGMGIFWNSISYMYVSCVCKIKMKSKYLHSLKMTAARWDDPASPGGPSADPRESLRDEHPPPLHRGP